MQRPGEPLRVSSEVLLVQRTAGFLCEAPRVANVGQWECHNRCDGEFFAAPSILVLFPFLRRRTPLWFASPPFSAPAECDIGPPIHGPGASVVQKRSPPQDPVCSSSHADVLLLKCAPDCGPSLSRPIRLMGSPLCACGSGRKSEGPGVVHAVPTLGAATTGQLKYCSRKVFFLIRCALK